MKYIGKAGYRVLMRDEIFSALLEFAGPLPFCHANIAELQAMWVGIQESKRIGEEGDHIEGYSSTVILDMIEEINEIILSKGTL